MNGNVVCKLGRCSAHFNNDAIDSATTLNVRIGLDDAAGGSFKTNGFANFNLLLQKNLEVVNLSSAIGKTGFALFKNSRCQCIGFSLEAVGRCNEVCFTLQLHNGCTCAVDNDGHNSLRVVAIIALCTCGKALFTQPLLGCFDVAATFFKCLLAIHHSGTS